MGTSSSRQRGNNNDIANPNAQSSSRSSGSSRSSRRRREDRDGRDTAESAESNSNATGSSNATRVQPQKPPIPVLYQTDVVHNHNNLHRNSIHLRKAEGKEHKFQLEFSFDCQVACKLTIWYIAEEITDSNDLTTEFKSAYPLQPTDVIFQQGMGLKHTVPLDEAFCPAKVQSRRKLYYHQGSNQYPLVIILSTMNDQEPQMQVTYATFKGHEGDSLSVAAVRQKLQTQDAVYEMKEVYGVEGGNGMDSTECVICMSSQKNTAVLPCRHLCMCSDCAKVSTVDKCPMCRCKVESLLQMNI